ncbi:MAG TPA: hypothetical protein VK666_11065 [Chryseolinea sp.]|nr:hypothetical protein [Chryseolinea sp.]
MKKSITFGLSEESYREYFTPQLKAGNFIDRTTSEYSDKNQKAIYDLLDEYSKKLQLNLTH